MFLDVYFGILPEDYVYELDAASGRVTGRVPLKVAEKYHSYKTDLRIFSISTCHLTHEGARLLLDIVMDDLMSVTEQAPIPSCAD